jgi:hypothetical protein
MMKSSIMKGTDRIACHPTGGWCQRVIALVHGLNANEYCERAKLRAIT